jgi:serine/threonine-protein kinase HipA
LPQEDCCQALSVPPAQKYQNQGGPGIAAIMALLKAGDDPSADRLAFFRSQILFWLIGATDGHGKNFSVALHPGGRFSLTPFYDVLSAQPTFDAGHIKRDAFKLSMSVGNNGKYRIVEIHGRHFVETAQACGMPQSQIVQAITAIRDGLDHAFEEVRGNLPPDFPEAIAHGIEAAARARLALLNTAELSGTVL